MNGDIAAMYMPRKSAQRSSSASSISSNASSTTVNGNNNSPQLNGNVTPIIDSGGHQNNTIHRKKPLALRNKAPPISGVSPVHPQTILSTNGANAASTMSSIQQQAQNGQQPTQPQQNGVPGNAPPTEATPALYLLSQNGTFERKTISVPYYPENLRIGRQTNAKTVPTPTNGYFDSKVLSRQHAEIWAERNGKIWIRDVRSSNGTFVNGARLSPENRDSDPHELQTGDHLELGIDIVSEDQKTVVHHKVAAKVEHAGFLGATNNVMEMNFGDLDPSNGSLMVQQPNGMMRGRPNQQAPASNNGRANGAQQQMNVAPPRSMNYWLTPVTTEAIVKKLQHEMRQAKLQHKELQGTEHFFDAILSNEDFKEEKKPKDIKSALPNGLKSDSVVARFSDPPAPPPQQPLPEKPAAPRIQTGEGSLRRANTERPRSQTNSPVKQGNDSQIVSLIEALNTAKKEIEVQGDRMRQLEEQLQLEREARLSAEEVAKRLECESSTAGLNGAPVEATSAEDESSTDDSTLVLSGTTISGDKGVDAAIQNTEDVEASANMLRTQVEVLLAEMNEMKQHMESYRQRAERAEKERDDVKMTLAEMVQKIRDDEEARRVAAEKRERRASIDSMKSAKSAKSSMDNSEDSSDQEINDEDSVQETPDAKLVNGIAMAGHEATAKELEKQLAVALQNPARGQVINNTAPYASMIGVVLLGMGLMAYLNGWQKVERG